MAEATLTETEVQPPEAAVVSPPESDAQSAPPPENTDAPADAGEETAVARDIVARIRKTVTKDAPEDGPNAAPDGAPAGPTADQIAANVRAQVESENRHKGLKWVALEDSPAKLWALADQLDEAGQRILANEINRIKGAVQPLADRAVDVENNYAPTVRTQALRDAETFTFGKLTELVKEDFGEAEATKFAQTNHGSWEGVGKYLVKAARKGYVPESEIDKALTEQFSVYEKELRARAAQKIVTGSLKELDGTGGVDVPGPTTTGGTAIRNDNENDIAFNAGRITPAQWKANADRFRAQENK